MAESAARAGYDVTSLDAFGDLDQHAGVRALSLPRDFGVEFGPAAAAAAARSIETDAVTYLSPFENHPRAVERLADGRMLWGNGAEVLRRVRDPQALPSLETVGSDRWLLKPRASGGGHAIRWWARGDPVPVGWHVQRFVDGVPGSIVFVVAAGGGCIPLGLTTQLVGERAFGTTGFRYCGNILRPQRGPASVMDSAVALARDVARRFPLVGVNCLDFIEHRGVAVPIEINPRWSASVELVERAYGVSVFAAHAAACTSSELPVFDLAAQPDDGATGKAVVFARHDVTCGDTRPWLEDPDVRDVPHAGEQIPAGRPVCTVFARGATFEACRAALVTRANRVYETLETWSGIPA